MKDLLSKGNYCNKFHILFMKAVFKRPLFIGLPLWIHPLLFIILKRTNLANPNLEIPSKKNLQTCLK